MLVPLNKGTDSSLTLQPKTETINLLLVSFPLNKKILKL